MAARVRPAEATHAHRLVTAQVAIDEHRLAPDGSWAVAVRRSVVRGEYRRHLWRIGVDPARAAGRPRALTRGRVLDTGPAVSPDGRRIAFLRAPADPGMKEEERTAQVWVMPGDGGEPWPIGRLPHGAAAVAWSPDGRTLAIVAEAADERFAVPSVASGLAPTVRRVTRSDFRDDTGFLDHRRHLWLVPARRRARPVQLTRGDFDVESPAWTPGGDAIVFTTDAGPDAGLNPHSVLCAVSTADGSIRRVSSLLGDLRAPAVSPDGRWIAAIGTNLPDPPEATQPELWLIDAATGEARSLTPDLDLPVGVLASTLLDRFEQAEGPFWLDAGTLVALVTRRGRCLPWRFTLSGSAEPMAQPDRRVVAAGLQVAGGRVVVNAQVDALPHELHAVENGRLRRLTRNGAAWRARFGAPRLEELEVSGPAGPIQVWLASPADGSQDALPTILDIHGGPTGSWGPGLSLDVLALTARGYRVALPNIRGSAGFGARWIDALGPHWGQVDAADALAVVDGLVATGLADPRRLGVIGLSYGGFLTNWLVGVTDRFAAAVSENGVTNQVTAWAECYFGIHDARRTGLGDALSESGVEALWERSPLRNVANVRTPLLLIQGEEDRICPASDNVQLFAALRALGREVEYLLYPEEHHVFSITGRPDRRIDRLQRVVAWFDRAFAAGAAGTGHPGS